MSDEQNGGQKLNDGDWERAGDGSDGVEGSLDPDDVDEIFGDSEGVDALIREAQEMREGSAHDRRGEEAARERYETQFRYVYPKSFDDPKAPKGEVTGEVRADDGTVLRRMTADEVLRLLRETEEGGEEENFS